MKHILNCASQPKCVLDLVDDIVDTCQVCRTWSKPLPASVATTSVSTKFNQQVEADLMFYKKHIIFHMLCRCTRWHAGAVIPDMTEETLTNAIQTCWVGLHGPMKELIIDGESGIVVSETTNTYLRRQVIELRPRAKRPACAVRGTTR